MGSPARGALVAQGSDGESQLVLHGGLQHGLHEPRQLGSQVAPQGLLIADLGEPLRRGAIDESGYRSHGRTPSVLEHVKWYARSRRPFPQETLRHFTLGVA
jgi:hypothetical protein